MADDLQTIVQRMIDAGESESNIAGVIQQYKAQHAAPAAAPRPAMADAPTTGQLRGKMLGHVVDDGIQLLGGIPDALAQVVQHPIDSLTAIPVGMLNNIAAFAKDPVGRLYEHPLNTALDIAGAAGLANAAESGVENLASQPAKARAAALASRVERYSPNISGYSVPANTVLAPEDARISGLAPTSANRPTFADPQAAAYQRVMQQGGRMLSPSSSPDAIQARMGQTQASPSAFVNVDSPMESGRNWTSGATTPEDKASAAALHRYDAEMDANYRRRLADPRGSAPIGMFLSPTSLLRQAAQAAWDKIPGSSLKTGMDVAGNAALISREAPPQTYKNALLQLLGGSQ